MANQKFTPTWIERLPYSSKRKVYIDASPNTKFQNCDFMLIVGARTKTAYLRYRPKVNGLTKPVLEKLGDTKVTSLAVLKEIYEKKVIELKNNESPLLIEKEARKVTLADLIDFYIDKKPRTDQVQMLRLKEQPYLNKTVGDLICADLDIFAVQDLLDLDVEKGSLYVANQKREFIQRVWNFAVTRHKIWNRLLAKIHNPATFSMKDYCGFTKKASKVHLPKEDYEQFFNVINTVPRSDFKDLIYMFLFTGQHPYSEVAQMRWDQLKEVEGQMWWMMEEGFHKTETTHSFPLHPMAMDIINKYKGCDDEYVFKNMHSLKHGLHNKDTFKNMLRDLRKKNDITWDIRCLRASFITCISELNPSYRAGILTNQAGQTITEKHYMRGDITYYDFKVTMINDYMNLIQDKLNGSINR